MRYSLHKSKCAAIAALMVFSVVAKADEPTKSAFPAMPEAFSSFGAAVANGYVYVYGGHKAKTHNYSTESVTGKFRRLNLANPASGWEELPAGTGLQGLALVAHNGKIYRIGGMQPKNKPGENADNHSVATCSVFDPKTNSWTNMPDMPEGRSSHDAAVIGDRIVVIGGWNMGGSTGKAPFLETSLVLDLAQKSPEWKAVPQPFKRRALNIAAVDGKVYAVGGMNWENEVDKLVDIFDPNDLKWTTGPAIPGPIMNGFTPAVCASGGHLYASPSDGKLYRLSEKKDAWLDVATLTSKRLVHRIVPLGENKILALGGTTKTGNLDTVEAVEPAAKEVKSGTVSKAANQQQFCPVMTTVPIDEDSREVEFNGVKIKICCATCVKKWKGEPEAYLNVALLPQLQGMRIPARKIGQVYCPVYTDRVVSSKDPSVVHNGTTIYFFNETAKSRFMADPQKYSGTKSVSTSSAK